MSKKNTKTAVVETEVKNEAVVEQVDPIVAALKRGYNEALTLKQAEYVARHDTSCASALAKAWIETGLTLSESMAFCVAWNAEHAPGNTWGSKKEHIKAHVAWLKKKYLFPITMNDAGKIAIGTQFEF